MRSRGVLRGPKRPFKTVPLADGCQNRSDMVLGADVCPVGCWIERKVRSSEDRYL